MVKTVTITSKAAARTTPCLVERARTTFGAMRQQTSWKVLTMVTTTSMARKTMTRWSATAGLTPCMAGRVMMTCLVMPRQQVLPANSMVATIWMVKMEMTTSKAAALPIR